MPRRFLETKLSAEWLFDKIWPLIWLSCGGAFTALAANATETVKGLGALGIFALAIVGASVFLGLYFLATITTKTRIQNKFAELVLTDSTTNPLDTQFDKKIIKLNDFYDPYYNPHINKIFTNCRFVGPGNIVLNGGTMSHCSFSHCQIVIARPDATLFGATMFSNATITNSTLANCTLIMTEEIYDKLPPDIKINIPVITELNSAI